VKSGITTAVRGLAVGSAMAVAGVLAAAPAAQAATFLGYEMTFQAPNSRQWEVPPFGRPVETPSALAAGTSPAIATLPGGGYQETIVASDRTWWVVNSGNGGHPVPNRPKVRAGTSAAIAAGAGGFWLTAAQADNGFVRLHDAAGRLTTILFAAAPNSNPSIAALSNGTFEIAFVGSDKTVWVANYVGGIVRDLHSVSDDFLVQPGTSAAIAADRSGGWRVSVQADTSRLWEIDSNGTVVETPSAMNPGTSPAIAALSTGGYVTVFVASSGRLWWGDAGGGHETDLVPDGSPVVATNPFGGWKAAFIGNSNNFLWTFDSSLTPVSTGRVMAAHTSPGIAALVR